MTRKLLILLAMLGFYSSLANAKDIDEIVANLSDADRKTIISLQQELSSWPKSVQDEIKAYQDFIFALKTQLRLKYLALSKEAKAAVKQEEEMISNLSPDGINALKEISEQNKQHVDSSK